MALQVGFEIDKCLPTEEDFRIVAEAKWRNDKTAVFSGQDVLGPGAKPFYYVLLRRFFACLLLKWPEAEKACIYLLQHSTDAEFDLPTLQYLVGAANSQKEKFANAYKKYKAAQEADSTSTKIGLKDKTPELTPQSELNWRAGELKLNVRGRTKDFFRILAYDTRYGGSGARRSIAFNKKIGNIYSITVLGADQAVGLRCYDLVFFKTIEEAKIFIANINNDNINTKYDLGHYRFVISDEPVMSSHYNWHNGGQADVEISDLSKAVKVKTACGDAYMLPECSKFNESLEEAVEKHETLNPKLFDGMELKQEVKDKVEEITNEMIRLLNDEEIKLEVRDVVITGSNASYNYTKDSDIDVHILAKTSNLDDPDKVYPKLYNAYRRIFASKYDISFYGIPVEVYIEVEGNETVSNGCYSVMFDHWVKEPSAVAIPEIDQKAIDEAARPWKEEAQALLGKNNIDAIDDYINRLYELRQKGLYSSEGVEYSTENLIFKEVRNEGLLDKLKEHRDELTSQELSLESLEEARSAYDLSEKDRREYYSRIAQLTHYQPLVQRNGLFEIPNVKEDDAVYILGILGRQDWIEWVQRAAEKYDFRDWKSFQRGGIPARLYIIRGKIRTAPTHELAL